MMGQYYLAHDETGGEQYIISVVETLHCYHAFVGALAVPVLKVRIATILPRLALLLQVGEFAQDPFGRHHRQEEQEIERRGPKFDFKRRTHFLGALADGFG